MESYIIRMVRGCMLCIWLVRVKAAYGNIMAELIYLNYELVASS